MHLFTKANALILYSQGWGAHSVPLRRGAPPFLPANAMGYDTTTRPLQHHFATVNPARGAADFLVRMTQGAWMVGEGGRTEKKQKEEEEDKDKYKDE